MFKHTSVSPDAPEGGKPVEQGNTLVSILTWVVALVLAAFALYLGWRAYSARSAAPTRPGAVEGSAGPSAEPLDEPDREPAGSPVALPPFSLAPSGLTVSGLAIDGLAISRRAEIHTLIPTRPRQEAHRYTVDTGDSVFGIAEKFNLKPHSVLWANQDLLNDSPDMLALGMDLLIPPTDGVLHVWLEGDTIQTVAGRYEARPEDILSFPGNGLDLVDPKPEIGQLVMVPGGHREFRQWIMPTIPRGRAGVSTSLYGGGACEGPFEGAFGSGGFIWPSPNHVLSGNDYWEGHLAIDIGSSEGGPVYAADGGVVVFAGAAFGGYGNMVMIDHGNGYQTLYAHLSSVNVGCGRSVSQGLIVGYSGSTGNSTGPHLHFEMRYQGGFVNPWHVLPAP